MTTSNDPCCLGYSMQDPADDLGDSEPSTILLSLRADLLTLDGMTNRRSSFVYLVGGLFHRSAKSAGMLLPLLVLLLLLLLASELPELNNADSELLLLLLLLSNMLEVCSSLASAPVSASRAAASEAAESATTFGMFSKLASDVKVAADSDSDCALLSAWLELTAES